MIFDELLQLFYAGLDLDDGFDERQGWHFRTKDLYFYGKYDQQSVTF